MKTNLKTNPAPLVALPEINWQTVRTAMDAVKTAGQTYLLGQVWLGWQLAILKEDHGAFGSGRRSKVDTVATLTWGEIVEQETGLNKRTADRLIQLFDATKAKLKRTNGALVTKTCLLAFERENPLTIIDEESTELRSVIASLCDGETQKSLLSELKVIAPPKPLLGGDTSQHRNPDAPPLTVETMAFNFFAPLSTSIHKLVHLPDLSAYLVALPIEDDDEMTLTLSSMERQYQQLIDEVKAAKKAKLSSLKKS